MTSTEELREKITKVIVRVNIRSFLHKDESLDWLEEPIDDLLSLFTQYSDARVKEVQLEIRKFLLDHTVNDTDEARFIEISLAELDQLTTPAPSEEK